MVLKNVFIQGATSTIRHHLKQQLQMKQYPSFHNGIMLYVSNESFHLYFPRLKSPINQNHDLGHGTMDGRIKYILWGGSSMETNNASFGKIWNFLALIKLGYMFIWHVSVHTTEIWVWSNQKSMQSIIIGAKLRQCPKLKTRHPNCSTCGYKNIYYIISTSISGIPLGLPPSPNV